MVVLMLLGTALVQYSVADSQHVSRDEKRMQAYYIARSGADAVAEWIINDPSPDASTNRAKSLIDATDSNTNQFGSGSLGAGTFEIDVTGSSTGTTLIKSTGFVGDTKKKVTVSLYKRNVYENVIYANKVVDLQNNSLIKGDIQAGEDIIGATENIDGKWFIESSFYPDKTFPTLPFNDPFNITSNPETITDEHSYGEIQLNNETLIFNTGAGEDGVLRVVVNKLTVNNGILKVEGNGKLELYINDLFDFKGEIFSPVDKFYIFGAEDCDISLQTGNNVFNGYIYAPKADIEYKSGIYTGAMIARNADVGSGGEVIYNGDGAPHIMPEDLGLGFIGHKRGLWSD